MAILPPKTGDPTDPNLLWEREEVLAYVIAIMNMILHGIEAPSISTRTLSPRTLPTYRRRIGSM